MITPMDSFENQVNYCMDDLFDGIFFGFQYLSFILGRN